MDNLENTPEVENTSEEKYTSQEVENIVNRAIEKDRVANTSINAHKIPGIITSSKTKDDNYTMRSFFDAHMNGNLGSIAKYRAMNEGTGTQGGFMVPEEFANEFLSNIRSDYGEAYRKARKIQFSRDKLNFSTPNQRPTASLKSEGAAGISSSASLNRIQLDSDLLFSIQDFSLEYYQDSLFNFNTWYAPLVAEQFMKKIDIEVFTNGTYGITSLTGTNTISLSAGPSSINYDKVIDMYYAVPAGYRAGAEWFGNSTYAASLMKIKDTTGQPIYKPGFFADGGDSFLGRRFNEIEALNSTSITSSGAKSLVFGNMNNYLIGERSSSDIEIAFSTEATIGSNNMFATYSGAVRFTKRIAFGCANPAAFSVLANA